MRRIKLLAVVAAAVSITILDGVYAGDPLIVDSEVKLTASDAAEGDGFGAAVAVAGDVAVVGAYGDDDAGNESGSAYVFERNAGGTNAWGQVAKLTASDAANDDRFGLAVSIAGDVALVGAYQHNGAIGGTDAGSAYVFERNADGTNAWDQVAILTALDTEAWDYFGWSVSVAGDVALVGAYGGDDAGNISGSAYIFERNAGGTNAWGEVRKLMASDGSTNDYFGWSVAVAGDVAVAGAYGDSDAGASSGSAYVFERNAGGTNAWGQVRKLTAPDGTATDWFGRSVAVAGDVVLVGAPYDDDVGDDSGSVYVFERNAGGTNAWGQVVKLRASDGAAGDRFGWSVSVADDVAVVGASLDDDAGGASGSAYIFRRNAGGTNAWGQVRKLTASDGTTNDDFGCSVSVAGDVALVGAYGDDDAGESSGSAYIIPLSALTKDFAETAKLTASDGAPSDVFGCSVSVDGDVALAGAKQDQEAGISYGAAYVFERNAEGTNAWGEVRKLRASDAGEGDKFGCAVSVDGDVALVGAEWDDAPDSESGSAYVFERNAGGTNAWGQVRKLTAPDRAPNDYFGYSVSVAGDVAVVGAWGDNASTGSVYVFERNAGGTNAWGQVVKLTASDAAENDRFGSSVSVDGDVLLVGVPYDDDNGSDSGSAYVFERNTGGTNAWGQARKLMASDGSGSANFGTAVAVAGDVALVGAPGFPLGGAAYVFERNAGGTNMWGEVCRLTASDHAVNDNFGFSVSAAGDVAVVGAYYDDDAGSDSGSAYVFQRNAGGTNAWGQVAKLTAADGTTNDWFGYSVSVAGDVAVVGSFLDDDAGEDSGSAYVFEEHFPVPEPVVANMYLQGGDVVCAWTSSVPVDYTVQIREIMDDGIAWSNLAGYVDLPGSGGTLTASNAVGPNIKRFYRIRATNSPIR
ncbi:MAG: FG-GAP repeat protein [Verrucomicrobia bacterium]|nr:FG-GAP repeat protein [Verrucomicrobiota bacterium]